MLSAITPLSLLARARVNLTPEQLAPLLLISFGLILIVAIGGLIWPAIWRMHFGIGFLRSFSNWIFEGTEGQKTTRARIASGVMIPSSLALWVVLTFLIFDGPAGYVNVLMGSEKTAPQEQLSSSKPAPAIAPAVEQTPPPATPEQIVVELDRKLALASDLWNAGNRDESLNTMRAAAQQAQGLPTEHPKRLEVESTLGLILQQVPTSN